VKKKAQKDEKNDDGAKTKGARARARPHGGRLVESSSSRIRAGVVVTGGRAGAAKRNRATAHHRRRRCAPKKARKNKGPPTTVRRRAKKGRVLTKSVAQKAKRTREKSRRGEKWC
jgi:hypothetical protein